tara:strand:- start:1397 stop:2164 length:768 start_codon:yes stop_codon:yes gene_type:complete
MGSVIANCYGSLSQKTGCKICLRCLKDTKYPPVKGEVETLLKIRKGNSIARFGDGEMGVSEGSGYTREDQNQLLSEELKRVLHSKLDNLLIGIPTMDPKGTKIKNWIRHCVRYSQLIPKNKQYWSSLISRPDCGAWMLNREYAQEMQKIWLDRGKVTVVCSEGQRNKLLQVIQYTNEVDLVDAPWRNAYQEIDRLQREVLEAGNDLAILSHGVSATCLAHRLAKGKQVQGVDIGSIGGFLAKMLIGDKWNEGDKV